MLMILLVLSQWKTTFEVRHAAAGTPSFVKKMQE